MTLIRTLFVLHLLKHRSGPVQPNFNSQLSKFINSVHEVIAMRMQLMFQSLLRVRLPRTEQKHSSGGDPPRPGLAWSTSRTHSALCSTPWALSYSPSSQCHCRLLSSSLVSNCSSSHGFLCSHSIDIRAYFHFIVSFQWREVFQKLRLPNFV